MAFFIISPEFYNWVILPALIFIAQIANVCMETLRIVFLSKGIKYLAAIIAFFEIIIWLLAIVGVISNLSNVGNFFAYAFGFALGTFVGLEIEERLSIGMVIMRIVGLGVSVVLGVLQRLGGISIMASAGGGHSRHSSLSSASASSHGILGVGVGDLVTFSVAGGGRRNHHLVGGSRQRLAGLGLISQRHWRGEPGLFFFFFF